MKRCIAFLLVLCFGFTSYAKEEPEQLYAQSAVLMDAESGRVLFSKNGEEKKAMASTTKIMTCILALEKGNLEEVVTFSETAVKQPKVHLGASQNEQFLLIDLLYSLMLESHNDSAVAIAEAISGDVEQFSDMMNEKAMELGCTNTYFITPNGLDAADEKGKHSTTAVDLAKIMSYCIMDSPQKENFLKITGKSQHTFTNIEGSRTYSCRNHNAFLDMMEQAISGKTGYTSEAGYCYVGAIRSEGRTFVVALLACGWPNNKNYKWSDMRKLTEYGIEQYHIRTIDYFPNTDKIKVINGIPKGESLFEEAFADTMVEGNLDTLSLLVKNDEEINYIIDQNKMINAPAKIGKRVGEIKYYIGEKEIGTFPIVIAEEVPKKKIQWYFIKVLELYCFK